MEFVQMFHGKFASCIAPNTMVQQLPIPSEYIAEKVGRKQEILIPFVFDAAVVVGCG